MLDLTADLKQQGEGVPSDVLALLLLQPHVTTTSCSIYLHRIYAFTARLLLAVLLVSDDFAFVTVVAASAAAAPGVCPLQRAAQLPAGCCEPAGPAGRCRTLSSHGSTGQAGGTVSQVGPALSCSGCS